MNRRQVFLCAVLALPSVCAGQAGGRSWGIPWSKNPTVVVISAENDTRLKLVEDAVEFWNRELAALGSPFRLGPVARAAGEVPSGELSKLSIRVLSRTDPPDFPEDIRDAPGDLVVALSDGDFASFAARWPARAKALIGIRSHRFRPLSLPNVARNVIAHEIGHAIGLGHNSDPRMLMCGRPSPCRPDEFQSYTERYFPLTDEEKAALVRMYLNFGSEERAKQGSYR